LKVVAINAGITLFPGESEKWKTAQHDFLYISSKGRINVKFNRKCLDFSDTFAVLIQCVHGSISIQNLDRHSVRIQSIKFSCSINLKKDFFLTDFNPSPFSSILDMGYPTESDYSQIYNLLITFQEPQDTPERKNRIDPRLIQVNRYIRKNYNSTLSLQELAKLAGVHPTYLSNTYSKVFKVSPIYFVNQLRMKKAKELLGQPLTLNKIASILGYNSLSQFSSIFKRFFQKTPTQYRELVEREEFKESKSQYSGN